MQLQEPLKVDLFLKNAIWLSGPPYLLCPKQEWPVTPDDPGRLLPDDPEVKDCVAVNVVSGSEKVDATADFIQHFLLGLL